MKNYHKLEHKILQLFINAPFIIWKGNSYTVEIAQKPRPNDNKGECKTDVYILLVNNVERLEIKLSVKMSNSHDFQESKLTKERAKTIFGDSYKPIIVDATKSIADKFLNCPLIFQDRKGNTEKGSVTMGWRLEITHSPRNLSVPLLLENKLIVNSFYKGVNMEENKRHAKVNETIIENAGVANYLIVTTENELHSYEDILNQMQWLDDMVPPPLYLAFIANNYRTIKDKIDGSRSLAVYVNWFLQNNKLHHELVFNEPLERKGKELVKTFKSLSLNDTFSIDEINIHNKEIIYCKKELIKQD